MSAAQIEIQLIGSVVAVACALPGVFLVLRRMSLMSDAISHAILFGIVIAFFVTHDLTSPFLVIAAALTGVLTVSLVELLTRTGLVREDASIGLVFPVLFSIGVILISRYAGNVHLDTDAILLGELAFAPFQRFELFGVDIGPKSFWLMLGILLLNVTFIVLFFKELKLATFDAGLAAAIGFSPLLLHYILMSLVSITAVGAFDAVGSILVVAFMIAPPATAYLLTNRLSILIVLSAFVGILSAVSGYWVAHWLDASIAGSMASMSGVIFGLTFVFAPGRGLYAIAQRHRTQRWEFAGRMLTVHLYQHEGLAEESVENRIDHLGEHMQWESTFAARVIRYALKKEYLNENDGFLQLTESGRTLAQKAIVE
ncbi:metal ABC transporter permease [bacterium]|nr:metal ABC transporter permease [bacterium]